MATTAKLIVKMEADATQQKNEIDKARKNLAAFERDAKKKAEIALEVKNKAKMRKDLLTAQKQLSGFAAVAKKNAAVQLKVMRRAKFKSELKQAGKEVRSFAATSVASLRSIGSAMTGIPGLALGALGYNILKTNIEFESLRATLTTITGSAQDAQTAFDGIKDFSTKTPFDIAQVTEAFIKLSALGLSPSERALTSYGNTASAMGKDLNQMIEAVADATAGEFERLKEFGIKAKSEGDNVSFTFNGITKTIKKDAESIQGYLLELGETKFAGAMNLQMDTLKGSISNLGVAWSGFIDDLVDEGGSNRVAKMFDFLADGVTKIGDLLASDSPMEKLADQTDDAKDRFDMLLSEYQKMRVFRINPFQSSEDLADEVVEAKKKWMDLQKQIWTTKEDTGKTFKEIAAGMDKVGGGANNAKDEVEDLKETIEELNASKSWESIFGSSEKGGQDLFRGFGFDAMAKDLKTKIDAGSVYADSSLDNMRKYINRIEASGGLSFSENQEYGQVDVSGMKNVLKEMVDMQNAKGIAGGSISDGGSVTGQIESIIGVVDQLAANSDDPRVAGLINSGIVTQSNIDSILQTMQKPQSMGSLSINMVTDMGTVAGEIWGEPEFMMRLKETVERQTNNQARAAAGG